MYNRIQLGDAHVFYGLNHVLGTSRFKDIYARLRATVSPLADLAG
jgi:hypothetical protein